MKKLLSIFLVLAGTSGCSTAMHRTVVYAESGVRAGSGGWDAYTDQVVNNCKERVVSYVKQGVSQAEAEAMWERCVGSTRDADTQVSAGIRWFVAAERLYWSAVAAGDKAGMLNALKEMLKALQMLPDEHFGGVKRLLKKIPGVG